MKTEKTQTFREFAAGQLDRLEIFGGWRMMDTPGRKVYLDWLDRAAAGDRNRVARFVDSLLDESDLATLAICKERWSRMFPPSSTASDSCPHCSGTGWEIVAVGANEGAKRCRCGGAPPVPDALRSWTAA